MALLERNRNLRKVQTILISGLVLGLAAVCGIAAAHDHEDEDESPGYVVGRLAGGSYMGVHLEEETDYEEGGARVTRVVDDSPAEEAGLLEGDIIVRFDGGVIRGPGGLTKHIHEHDPGDTVALTVVRDGKEVELHLELGDRSVMWRSYGRALEDYSVEIPEIEIPPIEIPRIDVDQLGDAQRYLRFSLGWGGRGRLGVQLVEVTPELREHLGSSADVGVLVSKVIDGTPADKAGIRVGDLIVSVGGSEIEDVSDLRSELDDHVGETFEVQVIRDGRSTGMQVTLPEPDDDRPSGPRASVAPRVARPAAVVPRASVAPAPDPVVAAVSVVPVAPVVWAVPAPSPAAPAAPRPVVVPRPSAVPAPALAPGAPVPAVSSPVIEL